MSPATSFRERLAAKVEQQLSSQNVGCPLGAGAACFNGNAYPSAGELWKCIAAEIRRPEEDDIQASGKTAQRKLVHED